MKKCFKEEKESGVEEKEERVKVLLLQSLYTYKIISLYILFLMLTINVAGVLIKDNNTLL